MMNPVTAMWINWALTALMGGFSAYQTAGGNWSNTTAALAIGGAVSALNGVMHMTSSSQAGPLGK